MADWPDADELKQVLDITSNDWDDTIDRVLADAIAQVKLDVGNWSEYDDEPDEALAQAALRMGELISTRPAAPLSSLASDPAYRTSLRGHRRAFGFA